jgi:3-hydroxyacyl-[acyl-carrier-protein] dehydratase
METHEILSQLPYGPGFCFVDAIETVNEALIRARYTFPPDAYFYAHHFPGHPVTPGVILTECMAQIGLVAWGIYLLSVQGKSWEPGSGIAFTGAEVKFLQPVFSGETVWVEAEQVYFRLGKLKVNAKMYNETGTLVCKGSVAGILRTNSL